MRPHVVLEVVHGGEALAALVAAVRVDAVLPPLVVLHVLEVREALVALVARVRRLVRVHPPPMPLQSLRSGETLSAIIAPTGLLSCVRSVVADQEAFVEERFPAVHALERRFPRVDFAPVVPQRGRVSKTLAADFTCVRFFSSMHSHMMTQVALSEKQMPANVAFMIFLPVALEMLSPLVVPELHEAGEAGTADLTVEESAVGVVCLYMLLQVFLLHETLVALVALVRLLRADDLLFPVMPSVVLLHEVLRVEQLPAVLTLKVPLV